MLNLSQFICYSLWFFFIPNAFWVLNTQKIPDGAAFPLGMFAIIGCIGWAMMLICLLAKEFDNNK